MQILGKKADFLALVTFFSGVVMLAQGTGMSMVRDSIATILFSSIRFS